MALQINNFFYLGSTKSQTKGGFHSCSIFLKRQKYSLSWPFFRFVKDLYLKGFQKELKSYKNLVYVFFLAQIKVKLIKHKIFRQVSKQKGGWNEGEKLQMARVVERCHGHVQFLRSEKIGCLLWRLIEVRFIDWSKDTARLFCVLIIPQSRC